MKSIKKILILAVLVCSLISDAQAQQIMNKEQALDSKEQTIVTISAFTANGDLAQLRKAFTEGLNAGMPINDIKEILVQLYAYAGFPRSLNALHTLMEVVKERKAEGISDAIGNDPNPLLVDKSSVEFGTANQTKLIGRPVRGEVYEFAPAIDLFLKAHLFGDIFGRDNLDWKTRELATISALAGLGGAENQLRSHFGVGMYNGLTEKQLSQLVSIVQTKVDWKDGEAANKVLQSVLKQRQSNTLATNEAIRDYNQPNLKTGMLIRISEIEIHRKDLEAYKAILKEESEASVRLEPGVISIFPMSKKTDSTQVRILEIYASQEAYELHLKTPHFQKYKTSTLNMVKSLQLIDMDAMDPETINKIFCKLNE